MLKLTATSKRKAQRRPRSQLMPEFASSLLSGGNMVNQCFGDEHGQERTDEQRKM
jgi:hypothetical protein